MRTELTRLLRLFVLFAGFLVASCSVPAGRSPHEAASKAPEPITSPQAPVLAPTEPLDFLLTLGGGLGKDVQRPPPQHLRIPAMYVRPGELADKPRGVPYRAGSVSLRFVYRDGVAEHPGSEGRPFSAVVAITAAGYQERALASVESQRGRVRRPALANGLQPFVYADPSKSADIMGRTEYVREDPELGFLRVYCTGQDVSTRHCSVQGGFTSYLTLSISVKESELHLWRETIVAARKRASEFVIPH